MKKPVLIALILPTILFSQLSLAYVLVGDGTVGPVKNITKGDKSKARLIEKPLTPNQLAEISKINKKKVTSSATAHAGIRNYRGRVNEHIGITGNHSLSITNNSSRVTWYKYIYTLTGDNQDLAKFIRNIDLKPGSSFYTNDSTNGDMFKESAGSYRLMASTEISGESSASDRSYGTATINK